MCVYVHTWRVPEISTLDHTGSCSPDSNFETTQAITSCLLEPQPRGSTDPAAEALKAKYHTCKSF